MQIALVKDSSLLREGIMSALRETFTDYEIFAFDSKEATFLLQNLVDIVIIDLETDIDLKIFINIYKSKNKKVIVWTSDNTDARLLTLFKLNLDGYFFNGMEKEELIEALHKVLEGGTYVHSDLSYLLLNDYVRIHTNKIVRPVEVLTNREWDVLELMVNGFNNDDIANELYISQKTVKNHVSSILEKLNVRNRTNAVILALKQKWFQI